jgi:hypothetical protein
MRKGMTMAGITEVEPTTTTEEPTTDIYIHHVLEGPFTRYDFEDMDDWTGPNEAEAFLLVKISQGDVVSDVEWYFHSVEEAFLWVRHFKGSIEPIVINGDTYG